MKKPELPGGTRSRSYRWVTAGFGLVFVALAIAILLTADSQRKLGSAVAAVIVGGLGGDAIVSAVRDRRSLLSRIGPLP
ncbi:hypothetical protein PGN35_026485 [Nodosilinea sp. PGN35]|uniref:hypothetical protein n=1 Tax=Nodosilinea sp. PGN35 TaxID=3020489 RepID=UPI0023B2F671|nr:hypothetical protein [Nodosilinea sp. TSF1-S3]MDF0367212.1 hypothetical protein [Nodosilinea sp. TSF1-S3]